MVHEEITLLSFGGGQDSTAILLKIIHDPSFKSSYVKGRLVVIMADTKNEHPETYEHVDLIMKLWLSVFSNKNLDYINLLNYE